MKAICDYVTRAMDNQPKPLTRELFDSFLNGSDVAMNCDTIRQHKPNAESYKRFLPAVTWQSFFEGKLRNDANAHPTGFYCLDVDTHHEEEFKRRVKHEGIAEAYKWAEAEAVERAHRWAGMQREEDAGVWKGGYLGIVAIHVSPSGTGVHVVACWDGGYKTIAENQARLASVLKTSYDEVCKDWARIFFLAPRKDWTYLDYDSIFNEE